MRLDMLLQILWPLERLAAEFTLVWLERHMHSNVRGNVVALDRRRVTLAPGAGQVEVIRRLAAYMALADVFLRLGVSMVGGTQHGLMPDVALT